jgi:DNA-binding LytR/AlgR family response regulator
VSTHQANTPSAILADDEEHLRAHLRLQLQKAWPELRIVAEASNGLEAEAAIKTHQPQVAFLDIKMPGLTGLEVAQRLEGATRFVFVTAYDQYALEAFEREAVDFLVKPVVDERLARTVKRLRGALAEAAPPPQLQQLLATLLQKTNLVQGAAPGLSPPPGPPRLRWLKASRGDNTVHVPVQDIEYLQSDDKYTIAHTADGEHVLRVSMSELMSSLDPEQFWQIHRSIIVNANHVAGTRRDESGRLFVRLRNRKVELPVSRAWLHLFKQN